MNIARPASLNEKSDTAATVVVLYQPTDEDIAHLTYMAAQGHRIVAVVNAADPMRLKRIEGIDRIQLERNESNVGLARALNQGLERAIADGADHVLLLDQDSRPGIEVRDQLVTAARLLAAAGRPVACVAPMLRDRKTAAPGPGQGIGTDRGAIAVSATFATSGTLVTRRGWREVGPMWEGLFIDGIDHEWCFRARARGLETALVPTVVMEHDMGDHAVELFGRFRPIHRSPIRHYHIVRNTLWLARRGYIPLKWRMKELLKLAYRCPVYMLVSADRRRTGALTMKAFIDGLSALPET